MSVRERIDERVKKGEKLTSNMDRTNYKLSLEKTNDSWMEPVIHQKLSIQLLRESLKIGGIKRKIGMFLSKNQKIEIKLLKRLHIDYKKLAELGMKSAETINPDSVSSIEKEIIELKKMIINLENVAKVDFQGGKINYTVNEDVMELL